MWKNASFVQSIFLIFAAIITGLSRALDSSPDFYSDDDDTGADAILSLRRRGLFDCSKAVLFVEVRYLAYLHDGDAGPLQTLLASKTEGRRCHSVRSWRIASCAHEAGERYRAAQPQQKW